ncbi:AAA family ATPase [Rhodobacter sp. 24-YEA-8]|uniref:AAA family ATPase n=1 Tax=Rhodobacter sp. 24-YEA-8 TaxID=1884310 RepID=UPI001495AD8E
MRISKITIENLRSVAHMSVNLDSVTTLIGGNNAGKPTTLKTRLCCTNRLLTGLPPSADRPILQPL